MMEGFLIVLMGLVYIGIVIFFIMLAIRFVNAIEKMSESITRLVDKYESR
jgi:hypothetical protein